MAGLLIFISAFISSYFYLTDPVRIKAMSQAYLSELVGGHVEIKSASLTLLEGLTLNNVRITVDAGKEMDPPLFDARIIEIQYNPASLLRGRLEGTKIIATDANFNVVEEGSLGHWNYERLAHRQEVPSVTQPSKPHAKLEYPELVLRNAQFHYEEAGTDKYPATGEGKDKTADTIAIDGHFFPTTGGSMYQFDLQSRVLDQGTGPVVKGAVTLSTGEVTAKLENLHFGEDVEAILPVEVRDFWHAHEIKGDLDIPTFAYIPRSGKNRARFKVQTKLKEVQLLVHSEEFSEPPVAEIKPRPELAAFPQLQKIDRIARQVIAWKHLFPGRPPIAVSNVSGLFTFDQDGISFTDINSTVAGIALVASGHIDGYSPDAPIQCDLKSKDGEPVNIPENPDFLPSLPGPLHQAYGILKPHGTGTFHVSLNRALPNGLPRVNGEVDIYDGSFDCIFFPYPIHGASGKVTFGPDPSETFVKVNLQEITGHGLPGGPNEHADVHISGWASANDPDRGCQIRVQAKNVTSEPAVFAALPPPVRKVMTIFKGSGSEPNPHFTGDFDCNVLVPPGPDMRPIVSVDLNFTNGSGKLAAFPYPLDQMTGQVKIRDGYLDVMNVHFKHAGTSLSLGGHVDWPVNTPPDQDIIAKPNLHVVVRNMLLDDELLKVLPVEAHAWLHSVGVTGMLDVDGDVVPIPDATVAANSIGYNLTIWLRDAAAHPVHSDFAVSDIAGKLMIHPDRMEVQELHGKRGDTAFAATGSVNWSTGRPSVKLNGSASQLILDAPLRELLPPPARQAWAALDPHGTVNAELFYQGICPPPPSEAIASLDIPGGANILPTPAPANDFKLTLYPMDVTVTPTGLPYRMDHCDGKITVTPSQVAIDHIHARHGVATIDLSGTGVTNNPNDWDLAVAAHNFPADDELRKALPLPMRQVLAELKYKGDLSVDLKTFRYRGDRPEPDVDLSGTLSANNGSVDVGVPIEGIDGAVTFDAAVRNGKLAAFRGDAEIHQMSLVDRPVKDFKATMDMPSGSDVLRVTGIHSDLAGGELAGKMDLKFPDTGPSSYSLDFQVKNADLAAMAKQVAPKGKEVHGQASASLALQGEWADPTTRRGRGDVLVTGKEVYQIPLLLGLLEVTNLSLPSSSPFSEGTARYLVEGNRITFEQVQMRSNSLVMSGNGWLDFASKQVRMNFTTENPNLPKLPIVNDLLEGAKQELLQIQVRGTVQSPKVSAGTLHTFTTTVDEVLNGSGKEK